MAYGFGNNDDGQCTIPRALLGISPIAGIWGGRDSSVLNVCSVRDAGGGTWCVVGCSQWVVHCCWLCHVVCPGMPLFAQGWEGSWLCGWVAVVLVGNVVCGWHMVCMLAGVWDFLAMCCVVGMWLHMVWPACASQDTILHALPARFHSVITKIPPHTDNPTCWTC